MKGGGWGGGQNNSKLHEEEVEWGRTIASSMKRWSGVEGTYRVYPKDPHKVCGHGSEDDDKAISQPVDIKLKYIQLFN